MPKPIKTREFKRDIKLRNPVRPMARQAKYAAIKIKAVAAKQIESQQVSPNDYAGEVIEEKTKSAASPTAQTLDTQGRKAVRKTYQLQREKAKKEVAVDTPAQQKKKKKPQKKQQSSKSKQPATPAKQEQKPVPSQQKTKKQKSRRKISGTQKNIKTVTQRTKQGQQATKSTAKTARNAKQTAQRIQQTTQQVMQNTKRAVKATYKAIKATYEGTKALIYAIIAGGWLSVMIIILMCLVGFLFASPFGIFFSSGGEKTMPQVIAELEGEFEAQLEQLQFNYVHDQLVLEGAEGISWPEVLAVYAVKIHSEVDGTLTLDEKNINALRGVLNEMYCYTYSVKTEQGDAGLLRVLTIELLQKSADEMADVYHFDERQRAQLAELLDPEQVELWQQLLA